MSVTILGIAFPISVSSTLRQWPESEESHILAIGMHLEKFSQITEIPQARETAPMMYAAM